MKNASVVEQAQRAFGPDWRPALASRAPGRVELLGNHLDYNGGIVLAGAIDRTVTAYAWTNPAAADTTTLLAADLAGGVEFIGTWNPPASEEEAITTPVAYLAGVLGALHERAIPVRDGLEIAVTGDVPVGFGMSSSAALCVALTNLLADTELSHGQIVEISRRAEHLTGAPVGAMDQSASVAGGGILFDGATGSITPITPHLGGNVFVVAHSGVHHALKQSAYPERVRESQLALDAIRAHGHSELHHLADLEKERWLPIRNEPPAWLPDPLHLRVDHVVAETDRVRHGIAAIEAEDWQKFGLLMTISGRSSATSYDISHPVVEELVAKLNALPGVLGARMMGGGEGGPALALVQKEAVPSIRTTLGHRFFARHDLDPETSFEVCTFGPGASFNRQ